MWPCGAPPGVPVTAAGAVAATTVGEDARMRGEGGSAAGAAGSESEPPRKPTRYEAMWTDCDPALWEYVVV